MDIHHIKNGTHTMADVIFNDCEGRHAPPPTMEHPTNGDMWRPASWHTWGPIP